jgi:Anti-sigma-K factor rskA, C-terminal
VRPEYPTDHETIEGLLAGYALGGLTGDDAELADRVLTEHVPACVTCRGTLTAFRDVTADLALSVDPRTPPETLLPRLHRELEPRTGRRRPLQALAIAAGVVAMVGLAGLTISQGMRASNATAKTEDLQAAAAIALRPDADLVPVGPVHEVSAPGMSEFYVIGSACPEPPEGSVYRLWLVADGQATFVTDFRPDDGQVLVAVPFDLSRYDDIWISVEPAGSEPSAPSSDRWQASEASADAAA